MSDPGRYGRSFAEVYDRWYPGGDEPAVVAHLREHVADGARVLELGVGTGRLAVPLAEAGFEVTGLDASEEMLAELEAKAGGSVRGVRGDAAEPGDWPPGPFAAVLAACNLLLNLPDAGAQRRCVEQAARALEPGGVLVVELQRLTGAPSERPELEVRAVEEDVVVLIATCADPVTGVVRGNHVELRDGQPVRLRPWTIRILGLGELDRWCLDAGLELVDRTADHRGTPDDGTSPTTVSVFRRTEGERGRR
jgi:SAM-dependent methyltransferase